MSVSADVQEVSTYLIEMVNARGQSGREAALFEIARAIGIAPSRVAKFIRLEIKRIWSDEYKAICNCHDDWVEREIKKLTHKAAMLQASGAARRARNA